MGECLFLSVTKFEKETDLFLQERVETMVEIVVEGTTLNVTQPELFPIRRSVIERFLRRAKRLDKRQPQRAEEFRERARLLLATLEGNA